MKNCPMHYLLLALFGMSALPAWAQDVKEDGKVAQGVRATPASSASAADSNITNTNSGAEAREKPLRDADALIKGGKPAEAYSLLEPLKSERSGEVRFGYLLGIAALDSGKPDKAALAFERVLAVDPGFSGARLDMARAYYQLGDLPHAKTEFEAVLKANPSAAVRATIQKYLAAIESHMYAKDIRLTDYQEGKVGHDSTPSAAAPEPQAATTNTALIRIERFQVKGNTLLDAGLIEHLLNPYKGAARSYTDIQLALEALEGAYRKAGYSAVHVVTPEQEITEGTITFQVIETVVAKVILKGNQHYDKNNIRNALPALTEGSTPNARELSRNIRLANENPTRQIDVVLALGEEENTVDVQVNVQDSSPHKVFVTLDNTGSPSTGMYRTGVGYQNNNLFNRDQAATFNYVTSPDHVADVTQLSASYRLPLYTLGDSMDMIAAHSDANAGTSPIVGGNLLTFSGKGNVYGAHYNHPLQRNGDYTSSIIAGLDYRAYFNNCQINGAAICGASGNDLTVHPVSITYGGTLTKPTYVADYAAAIVHNLPGGVHGGTADFSAARAVGAQANYNILRFNGSLLGAMPQDWQYRVAGNFQYTRDALVSYENIGLVGANAVRGFLEREVTNDEGIVLNLELYTPELAQEFHIRDGSFKFLGFIDHGQGWKVPLPGEPMVRNTVGSVGAGFRYTYGKNMTTKFDLARVSNAGGSTSTKTGDTRGQISVMASW